MTPTLRQTLTDQAGRLVSLGVHTLAGIPADTLLAHASALADAARPDTAGPAGAATAAPVLAVHPELVPATDLATLLRRDGKAGFVVVDLTDLAEFTPTDDVTVPDAPLYLLEGVDRGDDMLGWTPAEAHTELGRRGRTPLTVSEGVSWLLQDPGRLEPGACFMCVGSRKRKADGALDARTPAIWISGGTGRDGRERRGAPKVGWCWARNHHTWLGFASTAGRVSPGAPGPA